MGTRVKAGKKNKELDLYRIVMIAFVFFIACLVLSLHWFDLDLYWNWVSSNTIGFVLSAFWCQYHEIKAGELLPRYSSFYLKPKMSSVYIQENKGIDLAVPTLSEGSVGRSQSDLDDSYCLIFTSPETAKASGILWWHFSPNVPYVALTRALYYRAFFTLITLEGSCLLYFLPLLCRRRLGS